jgi:hypothetical protein
MAPTHSGWFRKRPVIIHAIQFTGDNVDECMRFCNGEKKNLITMPMSSALYVQTLEGTMQAGINDWIIRGINGEFYPCKPDIFERSYEPMP